MGLTLLQRVSLERKLWAIRDLLARLLVPTWFGGHHDGRFRHVHDGIVRQFGTYVAKPHCERQVGESKRE